MTVLPFPRWLGYGLLISILLYSMLGLIAHATSQALQKERLERFIHEIYGQSHAESRRIVDAAFHWGARRDVPPTLLLGIMANESSFNHRAIGGLGEIGLMQVLPTAHRELVRRIGGRKALLDPYRNIEAGSAIIASYIHLSRNNFRLGLWHYNGGGAHNPYPGFVLYSYWCLEKVAKNERHSHTCKKIRHHHSHHHHRR